MKLRTRSAYVGMLGMDMEAMMRGNSTAQDRSQQPAPRGTPALGSRMRCREFAGLSRGG